MQKKSIGLKSEKKSLHVQHIFLYISLSLFCTTSTYVKRPSCTFYGEKTVYVPTFHFCFTAAHFFRNELRLLSFFFLFVLFCQFRSSFFSVIGVSVMVVGGNSRTHDHVITKFSRILQVTIFFARARASLILILYYGKWLIINSAIFSNSCPVIAEMHILSLRFS